MLFWLIFKKSCEIALISHIFAVKKCSIKLFFVAQSQFSGGKQRSPSNQGSVSVHFCSAAGTTAKPIISPTKSITFPWEKQISHFCANWGKMDDSLSTHQWASEREREREKVRTLPSHEHYQNCSHTHKKKENWENMMLFFPKDDFSLHPSYDGFKVRT